MNYDMTNEEMAHYFAARYGNPEKYEDLYQEAWVAILEAEDKGLDRKGCVLACEAPCEPILQLP